MTSIDVTRDRDFTDVYPMRIFVTGIADFIRSCVSELLLRQRQEGCAVDDLCSAHDIRLNQFLLDKLDSRPHLDFRLSTRPT